MEEIKTLQQINVLGDTTLTGEINVTNDSNSTSFTTGSIVLAGGLGVAKDVFVNGISHTSNMHLLDATGTTVSNQYFNGTTWKIENEVGNQTKTLDVTQSAVTLTQSTPATSNTTGAIAVVGGISTQNNVWAKGNVVTTNAVMTPSTPLGANSSVKNGIVFMGKSGLVNDNSGNLFVGINANEFGTRNNATQGAVIQINQTNIENNVFEFSAITAGATGKTSLLTIDQNGSVKVQSTANSSSTSSGALQVAGGMAVAKNMNIGGTFSLWDGANGGTINQESANLNVSSTNISLSGNVQIVGNVQVNGNVTLNGSSVSSSSSSSSSSSVTASSTTQLEPAGVNWTGYTIPQNSLWLGTCWSPEKRIFVSVSLDGAKRVMTSPDGLNWTLRDAASNAVGWDSVCWSSKLGIFCAVGSAGSGNRTMTSTTGFTWTSVASAVADSRVWYDVCWSPDREIFCAVGSSGVMTSPNGTTWTLRTVQTADWRSVVWSPQLGLFCAVAMTGTTRITISSNGIDWTGVNPGVSNAYFGVAWSPQLGLFCAVGVNGSSATRLMTSSNGTTWISRTPSSSSAGWLEVEWSPEMGIFCAVGVSNAIMTSLDGINWTGRTSTVSSSVNWRSLAWSPELKMFVAVSQSTHVMTSIPLNYTVSDSNNLDDCILHSHIYNLANPNTTKTMLSSSYSLKDYSTNTTFIIIPNTLHFYAVRLVEGQTVKGVFFWTNSASATIAKIALYSADGTRKVLGLEQSITGNGIKYLPLTNTSWTVDATGIYYISISTSSLATYQPAGYSWTASTTSNSSNNVWVPIAWSPKLNLLVTLSQSGNTGGTAQRLMTSSDGGATWTIRNVLDRRWAGVSWSPKLNIFAAVAYDGTGNQLMTSPDGINWTTYTITGAGYTDIIWSPELSIYCSISFNTYSSLISSDGVNWSVYPLGFSAPWRALDWSPKLGLFVGTCHTNNITIKSSDGINWTSNSCPAGSWIGLCWSPELEIFVAVSETGSGNQVMTSPDGANWTIRTTPTPTAAWFSVIWSKEMSLFCSVAYSGTGNRVMTSPNGINWTTYPENPKGNALRRVIWCRELNKFVAVCSSSTSVAMTSIPTGTVTLSGTPINIYGNYGASYTTTTGKLNSTACQISSQTSMPASISGLTTTPLLQLAYAGVYKDGV
jgi:hypothetical protein